MTAPQIDVSVIVPAYKAEAFIARALNSIAAQTALPREVVVVDDGSPDRTAAAAEACREALAPIALRVIRQDNRGAGAARNRAVQEASSTYVAFLDADDEWLAEKLERSLAILKSENLLLVAHNYDAVTPDGAETRVDCHARFEEGPDAFVSLYRKGYLATSTLVTLRDMVIEAGGFDETLGNAQDFDLWLTLLAVPGRSFAVFDASLTRYHITAGSVTTNTARRIRCCMEIAHRFAATLQGHRGGVYRSVWFRTLAVHHEAIAARRARGNHIGAFKTGLAILPRLVAITLRVMFVRPAARERHLVD